MEHTVDNLSYSLTPLEEGKLRIVINKGDQELGSLYYEKAKKTFQRKPISMGSWACVDAKIEDDTIFNEDFTPKQMVGECQESIKRAGY